MTGHEPATTTPPLGVAELPHGPRFIERRFEPRNPVSCDLWMIDHHGSTVLRCHCIETSGNGMRLRVPLGYGVSEGQRYELCSHLPGTSSLPGFGIVGNRWATVVRTELQLDECEDHLDVGVVLDVVESPLQPASRWHASMVR